MNDKSSIIDQIIIEDETIEDSQKIAESFNDHFCSISGKIAEKIIPTDHPPDENFTQSEQTFDLDDIGPEFIIELVKDLKSKTSLDSTELSCKFIKCIINEISMPLCHIFNLSFKQGHVPHQLKLAKVVPIFKKGGKQTSVDDYRPISLLPVFSKILEKIVTMKLSNYLSAHNIIHPNQYGFQSKHSTIHPMIHLLNKVGDAMNKKQYTIGIFWDLKKAFDLVPHDILLSNLKKVGIRGSELKWFGSYLKNRTQFVNIGNSRSSTKETSSGVPQGSVLGPILFIIFFNDLPNCCRLRALIFADDTTLLASGENLDDLIDFVNSELHKLVTWFRANRMCLHPEKTKFIVFHSNDNIPWNDIGIFLNHNEIDGIQHPENIYPVHYVNKNSPIPAIKFLGVYLDQNLNFKYHINQINSRISKSLFSIRRVKNVLTPVALKSLYYSLIHSHIVYAIQIYLRSIFNL